MGAFNAILATTVVLLTAHGAAARVLESADVSDVHCGDYASAMCCHPEYGACAPGLVCTDNLCEPCGENGQEPCDETAAMLWSVTFTLMDGGSGRGLAGFYGSDITGSYGIYGEYDESDWIGSGGGSSGLGGGSSGSGAGTSGSGSSSSGLGAGSSSSGAGIAGSGAGSGASDAVGGAGTGINNQKKDSSNVPRGSGIPPADDDDDDDFASDGNADGSASSIAGGAATGTVVAAVAGVAVLVAGVGALTYARRCSRAA